MKVLSKTTLVSVALVIVFTTLSSYADTIRHVVWKKEFIPIELPIGHDTIIQVCAPNPDPSQCDAISFTPYLPKENVVKGDLKWINNQGTLYLNASQPFSQKLAELKLNNDHGDIILLRLSARAEARHDRIQIVLPGKEKVSMSSLPLNSGSEAKSMESLVRWVAQRLYAPKRLLTQPRGIERVPMHTQRFIPLYRGGQVSSMPLASWRAGDHFVTAVLLRNVLPHHALHLRYTMLRGKWVTASFFRLGRNPSTLTPARTAKDSTTAILISTLPFETALKDTAAHV